MRKLTAVLFLFAAAACVPARAAEPPSRPSLTRTSDFPIFHDEDDLKGLNEAVEQSLNYYRQLPPGTTVRFGADAYSSEQMADSMMALGQFLGRHPSIDELNRFIRTSFNVYRASGAGERGEVVFSAYYEASLRASLAQTAEYRYPIYARPPDLLDAQLGDFDPSKKGERIAGRADGRNLVPYYTREDIDSRKVLQGEKLEIAWARSPLDIFFLQIQGSGWLETPEGEHFHIRYAGDNGRPYRSVGQYLIESGAMSKADFSKPNMVRYLDTLSEAARQQILNEDPRYIFFELTSATTPTRGSLLVSLTPERSIASDPKVYPPGALAWISSRRPVLDASGAKRGAKPFSRFVLNQDEGGAIKGPGRIDFFVGRGPLAEKTAESLWYPGQLFFLVHRPAPH